MRSARRQFFASSIWLGTLAAAAAALLTAMPGLAMPSGDIVQNPLDDLQLSEPTRNRIYEDLTPLTKEKDQREVETKETPPPESPETPQKEYGLKDPPSQTESEQANGGQVPSKGHPMSDGGKICPDGKYGWCGADIGCQTGCTPNPSYAQAPMDPPADVKDLGNGAMMDKLREPMNGLPMTNSQFAVLAGMAPQAGVDQALDPKGWRASMKQMQQTQTAQGSNQQAQCAESNTDCAFEMMGDTLINVANEGAATPASPNLPFKTYSQAIWMIQQMYKQCYLPMAILLLLPGAVLTQVKGLVSFMILGSQDEDAISPIAGITRGLMAIFLIPATQLIVSYVIDIGNSLTYAVKDHINIAQVTAWAQEQTFNPPCTNNENCIKKIPDTGIPAAFRGKLASASEKTTIFERQSYLTTNLQNVFNTINNMISQGLAILNGFQIILMCYLFLIGPIAAAFFAWPSGVGRDLFKKTFSTWMDGVVVLALWKFWWCIVLLCMSVRLSSGNINVNDQFEMYIYTSFMALLLFVPFQPFDFRPGEIVGKVLEKAAQGGAGGAGGSGGGCGSGGSAGAGAQGGACASEGSGQSSAESGSSQPDGYAGITGFSGGGDSFVRNETNASSSQTANTTLASVNSNNTSYQTDAVSVAQPPRAAAPETSDKSNLTVAMSDVTPPPLADRMAA